LNAWSIQPASGFRRQWQWLRSGHAKLPYRYQRQEVQHPFLTRLVKLSRGGFLGNTFNLVFATGFYGTGSSHWTKQPARQEILLPISAATNIQQW